jgi:hypothetical protein
MKKKKLRVLVQKESVNSEFLGLISTVFELYMFGLVRFSASPYLLSIGVHSSDVSVILDWK